MRENLLNARPKPKLKPLRLTNLWRQLLLAKIPKRKRRSETVNSAGNGNRNGVGLGLGLGLGLGVEWVVSKVKAKGKEKDFPLGESRESLLRRRFLSVLLRCEWNGQSFWLCGCLCGSFGQFSAFGFQLFSFQSPSQPLSSVSQLLRMCGNGTTQRALSRLEIRVRNRILLTNLSR